MHNQLYGFPTTNFGNDVDEDLYVKVTYLIAEIVIQKNNAASSPTMIYKKIIINIHINLGTNNFLRILVV
jgi:hypothetical protein